MIHPQLPFPLKLAGNTQCVGWAFSIRRSKSFSLNLFPNDGEVALNQQVKDLIQKLGEAIHESVSESDQISGVVREIREQGFDVLLMLEATIGLNEVDDEPETIDAESDVLPTAPSPATTSPSSSPFASPPKRLSASPQKALNLRAKTLPRPRSAFTICQDFLAADTLGRRGCRILHPTRVHVTHRHIAVRGSWTMRDTLGVLLAGGAGERLFPLTRDRAKPAVPFAGQYRIIDITLSNCINSDLRHVYILTQYKALSLNRHIREGWGSVVASELGEFIEILPPMQRVSKSWYQGTADAVFQNIYSIGSEEPKHVLILSGDHIYKMNYALMKQQH